MAQAAQTEKTYSGNGGGGRITPMKKGERRCGRQFGTPNKTTVALKEAILLAGEAAGNQINNGGLVGYLTEIGLKHPKVFCSLLARLIPKVPKGQENREVVCSLSEIKAELLSRGTLVEVVYEGRPALMWMDGSTKLCGQAGNA